MSNIIDSIQLSGVTYTLSAQTSGGGNPTVELTQAQYDALVTAGTVQADTYYIITDAIAIEATSAVTRGSTAVVTSGGVYEQVGGIKIVKLTESEYTALVTKDSDTLYVVVPDPSN